MSNQNKIPEAQLVQIQERRQRDIGRLRLVEGILTCVRVPIKVIAPVLVIAGGFALLLCSSGEVYDFCAENFPMVLYPYSGHILMAGILAIVGLALLLVLQFVGMPAKRREVDDILTEVFYNHMQTAGSIHLISRYTPKKRQTHKRWLFYSPTISPSVWKEERDRMQDLLDIYIFPNSIVRGKKWLYKKCIIFESRKSPVPPELEALYDDEL